MNKTGKARIGMIAHIAEGEAIYDGQTVKSRTLLYGLRATESICLVDTYMCRKNPLLFVWKTIRCMAICDHILILLSRNGLRVFLPILSCLSKMTRKRVYHCVIGGNDEELLSKYPKWIDYLSSFEVNWYESPKLVNTLKSKGLQNAEYLPNFKDLERLSEKELEVEIDALNSVNKWRYCTFSRVTAEKGITDAVKAIKRLREDEKLDIELDVYGPIDNDYAEEFQSLLARFNFVKYLGIVKSSNSVNVIKQYYGLLFPTYFYGEGFPGTLIDAMCAGVPVIASNWHMNSEIIQNGADGLIYERENEDALEKAILWSIKHAAEFNSYKKNIWNKASTYLVKNNIGIIRNRLEVGGKNE